MSSILKNVLRQLVASLAALVLAGIAIIGGATAANASLLHPCRDHTHPSWSPLHYTLHDWLAPTGNRGKEYAVNIVTGSKKYVRDWRC